MLMHTCVSRRRCRVYPSGRKKVFRESTCLRNGLMAKPTLSLCTSEPGVSVRNTLTTPEITARTSEYGFQDELRTRGAFSNVLNASVSMEQHPWQDQVFEVHNSFKVLCGRLDARAA